MLLPLCYINTFDIVFMINKYDVNVYNNIHVSLELCQWHSFVTLDFHLNNISISNSSFSFFFFMIWGGLLTQFDYFYVEFVNEHDHIY